MIYLKQDFDPIHTFECGQCFRWNQSDNGYIGICGGKVCRVSNDTIYCPDSDNEYWTNYFSADTDYSEIKKYLESHDETLKKCIDFGGGIRILHQDIWETIISFIISANNNIPRIKKILETMCREFGDKIDFKYNSKLGIPEGEYYSFPEPEHLNSLSIEDLACLRAGYRDKYIMDAAEKVSSGEVNLKDIPEMPTELAKKELLKIKGVGGKVADCILLFSMGRYELFPKDVWIKRILNQVYGVEEKETDSFVTEKYGNYAGFAQQYMYYYYRENDIEK